MVDEFIYEPRVAYFSMEIALRNEIPTYAGGLGILAGDTIAVLPLYHAEDRAGWVKVMKGAIRRSLQLELGGRAVEGRVVECHGDLRPEHICLSPLCIIDSLEFSRELRVLDPAEELAFLRLECEVAGAPEVADRIVSAYQDCSGDRFSRELSYCYEACRALVRAKILAWHILDPTVASLAPWTEKAHAYIAVAERYGKAAPTGASN